jgi:hypothetical protein
MVLAGWVLFSGTPGEPVGGACKSAEDCQSGICLPDADPEEVARFVEIAKAYEIGQNANPDLAGQIEDLLRNLPYSSLTLRPVYPGVCTLPCKGDPDCPQDMFCTEVVWLSAIQGIDKGWVKVCMPAGHPAARLVRRR